MFQLLFVVGGYAWSNVPSGSWYDWFHVPGCGYAWSHVPSGEGGMSLVPGPFQGTVSSEDGYTTGGGYTREVGLGHGYVYHLDWYRYPSPGKVHPLL